MKKALSSALVLALTAICIFGLASCKKRGAGPAAKEQEWFRYISGHTAGMISRKSDIRVLFVDNVSEKSSDTTGLLEFSPSIAGTGEWKSLRELVFTPKQELKPGTEYKAVLHVNRILKLPRTFDTFTFSFAVIKPQMEIVLDGLFSEDASRPDRAVLKGRLETSDVEEPALVEKVLESAQDGKKLDIAWSHAMGKLTHYFTIKDVERREQASEVSLTWDGSPIHVDNRGYRSVPIPPLGQFELLSVEAVIAGARHIVLRFSDPLARDQNLQGLVRIDDRPLTFEISGNILAVFSTREFSGTLKVIVSPGIRNAFNRRLVKAEVRDVTFESQHPQVRFVGSGVILPQKDRLTVPFSAVNLKTVHVAAFQIYANNMAQFFQFNPLEGNQDLFRVGRYLWRKTLPLSDDPAVTGAWANYELDVTSLFKENPGSLFRIEFTFERADSAYPCPEGTPVPAAVERPLRNQDDVGYYDYNDYEYDYRDYDNNWRNRNNPCADAYYNPAFNSQARVGRNFLASNIGLTGKLEKNGTLHVVTTDLGTAQPLSGTRVQAFNFQNQLLGEAASDGNGFASLTLAGRPFYVAARAGNDVGYLRLSGDSALATSSFDVGGEAVEKGIKGVIYGERGVWRPGDTLYLTFVLYDREHVLPQGHPVVMELYSPQGQLVQTFKPGRTVAPFYAFEIPTDEAAPTGNWRARVLVGGLTFTKNLRIETVVPNRLKIDFQTGREVLTRKDVPLEASIASQWLHGAPAANLKFDVTVRLSARPTRFTKYPDYVFDDPAREFTGGDVAKEEGRLDAQGKGTARLDFAPKASSPGLLDALFVSRVFEESGDFSIDTFSQPFYSYDSYVGVRTPKAQGYWGILETDKDQTVDIVTVDAKGQPVSRDRVIVSLYKVDWRWWWDRSGESLAQYVSNVQTRPIQSAEIATRDGAGHWTFQIHYPDWGRFLVRVEDPASGHASGQVVYIDWPGWAGRSRQEGARGATRLSFTADKDRYKVGEKAVIFLPEAVQGRALVSVENGSEVLQKMWVATEKGANRFEIPLTDKMTPNVYVHVSLLQPHRGKVSDTPIRLYGVIPIMVEDPATKLEPVVQTAEEIRPKEKFAVRVGEKAGRPMTYTVAVVDEGLLGLTRFVVPDLRSEFYRREALGVMTWDLFDSVVEAYGAELGKILALGGGEGAESKDKARKPRRFPPVVLFAGPFELKAGETASHEFAMPQYFGAVRVMVVAGRDGAYGSAERSVPVRRDLMALATLPRVVRPGEDVAMPISVFVTSPALKEVTVTVEPNAMFQVLGESSKTLTFARPGDDIVTFDLKTAAAVGQGEVRFRVASGAEKTEDTISVPVLGSNPYTTQTTRLELKPGQTLTQAVTPSGLENTNTVTVEASTVPQLNLDKRLEFLVRYPHGCLEQTLSAAFPQLYLKGLVRLDDRQAKAVQDHIDAAIDKLNHFQTPNGAFAYWPGGGEGHEWTSIYAGWFLLEASRLGYRVPQNMVDKWKANQKLLANIWTTGPPAQQLTQAFRLYTLALARDPDLGAMNRLRETEGLTGLAAVELAAAFHVTGQADAAADLVSHADVKISPYRDDWETFGSDFRDRALLVRCYSQVGRSDKAKPFLDVIIKVAGSDVWLSTNETSFALMAISSFYGTAGIKPFRFRMGWDGEAPKGVESNVPFYSAAFPDFPTKGRTLTLVNDADAPLYVSIYRRGMPPAGVETPSAENLSIAVTYRDMKMSPIAIDEISQGMDFVFDVRVKNLTKRALKNLVLTHLVAAGFQIKNPRFTGESGAAASYDYQDIRDDRVYSYFGLEPEQERTILVVVNASYRGRYYQPGVAIEAMYDASVHANSKGQWVKIVQ